MGKQFRHLMASTITNGKEKWRQDQHTYLLYPPAKVTDNILRKPDPNNNSCVTSRDKKAMSLWALRVITVTSAMRNSENCFNYYFINHKLCKEANTLHLQTCFFIKKQAQVLYNPCYSRQIMWVFVPIQYIKKYFLSFDCCNFVVQNILFIH